MAVIQRWELVEYSVDLPADQRDIAEILDRLRAELPNRWEYRETVKVTMDDRDQLVFRYRKAQT
ncbi:hypothetical protein [Nonomuraea angiospora]|uniref:hypothetical protein n=1 Tax=Nonomuraea angiospora TaxID=46172 RepID=UPI0029AF278B|nr:hypothetical protein [Nonomuraea angiospora]MDX3100470.1 hypothetical protein [Nonomuraea angiospora]